MKRTLTTTLLLFCCSAYPSLILPPVDDGLVFSSTQEDFFMQMSGSQVAICVTPTKEPSLCKVIDLQKYVGTKNGLECKSDRESCIRETISLLTKSNYLETDYLFYSSFEQITVVINNKTYSAYANRWYVLTTNASFQEIAQVFRNF